MDVIMDVTRYMSSRPGIFMVFLTFLSSGYADDTSDLEVWGIVGGRASLPCKPEPTFDDDSPVLVLWYTHLSGNNTPVYSYDARQGNFITGNRWADMHTFGGRAYFSALSVPPSLILDPLRSDDGGIYSCRIDYKKSPSTRTITNLTVIVPPGPPVILWNGVGVVGSVGPLQENSQLTLICRSSGGSPPPVLTWWWRGEKLSHQTSNVTFHKQSGSLMVESTVRLRATRGLHAALLTCHAQSPSPKSPNRHIILQPRTASVALNVTLPPLEITIAGVEGPVSSGTALQIECRSVGSNPPAKITWWRGHTHLTEVVHSIYEGGNLTIATLTLVTNRELDGATLACTANNPLLQNSPATRTIRLQVLYPPVATLRPGRAVNTSIIQEGNDIYFECDVKSNPSVQRVVWLHNGVILQHNVKAGIVINGLTLALQKLSRGNSGSYSCVAYNQEGSSPSNTIHLNVRHVPQCIGGAYAKTVGAAKGAPALLTCRVEAEPSDIVEWEWIKVRDDDTEEQILEEVRSSGLGSSVVLTPFTPEDYGDFMCRAANSIGMQKEPCIVRLVPAGPPDPPVNCTATALQNDQETMSLAIVCQEGFDGGLHQDFHLEAHKEEEVIANSTSEFPEWTLEDLDGGVSISIQVTAQNVRGKSEAVSMEVHTPLVQHSEALDNSKSSQKTLLGATTLLGALVGVVVVLVILIVVSILIARRAKPQPKNKPTIISSTPVDGSWESYNPDLVSSAQQRQLSREAVNTSHQSLPSPRLQTLMQRHRNPCLPLNERAQNCIQMHRKSLPHLLINSQQPKFASHMELQSCEIYDSGSDSSTDSDVESVIEVTDLATKGLTKNAKGSQYQLHSPSVIKTEAKENSYGVHSNVIRSPQNRAVESDATRPLLTKDERLYSTSKIVSNLNAKNTATSNPSEKNRVNQNNLSKTQMNKPAREREKRFKDVPESQSKTPPDSTPPPKPPRVFNLTQVCTPSTSPECQKKGSKLNLLESSKHIQDSMKSKQEDKDSAPIARDEVSEVYGGKEGAKKLNRSNGIAGKRSVENVSMSHTKETTI